MYARFGNLPLFVLVGGSKCTMSICYKTLLLLLALSALAERAHSCGRISRTRTHCIVQTDMLHWQYGRSQQGVLYFSAVHGSTWFQPQAATQPVQRAWVSNLDTRPVTRSCTWLHLATNTGGRRRKQLRDSGREEDVPNGRGRGQTRVCGASGCMNEGETNKALDNWTRHGISIFDHPCWLAVDGYVSLSVPWMRRACRGGSLGTSPDAPTIRGAPLPHCALQSARPCTIRQYAKCHPCMQCARTTMRLSCPKL